MGGFPERAKHQHFGLCANRRFLSDRSGGWITKKKNSYPVDQNYYCKPKFVAVWLWYHSHRLVPGDFRSDQMQCDAACGTIGSS